MSKAFEKLNSHWSGLLQTMKDDFEISDHMFDTFVKDILKPIKFEKNTLYIEVPEEGYIGYINNHILSPLRISIAHDINIPVEDLEISFSTKNSINKINQEDFNIRLKAAGINEPKNTFENFIQGASNALAYATSIAIAENPGENYNPLFIYSKTGLGKTHLLHAIANFTMKKYPNINVLFTTCENFTTEFLKCLRDKKMSDFKKKYRSVDMLLIDDIYSLSGKPSTQEEFFNTFNELYSNKKQIVLTSDKPIKEIEGVEERILSRFMWGTSCDIQLPDYETRLAILRKKEELIRPEFPIDNEVMKYIAQNIKSNIRELEGELKNIINYSRLINKSLDINIAKEVLKNIKEKEEKKITPDHIINVVCDHFGVNKQDICSQKRNREYVYARDIAIYLCRSLIKDITQEKIGSFFNRDHSTVINCCSKIESRMKLDKDLVDNIENIEEKLTYK